MSASGERKHVFNASITRHNVEHAFVRKQFEDIIKDIFAAMNEAKLSVEAKVPFQTLVASTRSRRDAAYSEYRTTRTLMIETRKQNPRYSGVPHKSKGRPSPHKTKVIVNDRLRVFMALPEGSKISRHGAIMSIIAYLEKNNLRVNANKKNRWYLDSRMKEVLDTTDDSTTYFLLMRQTKKLFPPKKCPCADKKVEEEAAPAAEEQEPVAEQEPASEPVQESEAPAQESEEPAPESA